MTVGIYSLYWEQEEAVYIGQSVDILKRFNVHLNELLKGAHANYRVQQAYNRLGKPKLQILEQDLKITDLNDREIYWSKEFNPILNLLEVGTNQGHGCYNSNSKHSLITILRVFSLLYKSDMSLMDISKKCRVPKSTVNHIANQRTHKWLSERYPDKFIELSKKIRQNNGCKVHWIAVYKALIMFLNKEPIKNISIRTKLSSTGLYKMKQGKAYSNILLYRPEEYDALLYMYKPTDDRIIRSD